MRKAVRTGPYWQGISLKFCYALAPSDVHLRRCLGQVSRNVDLDWSDLLLPLRDSGTSRSGDNKIVDDEFLRLFHFIGDLVVQRCGLSVATTPFEKDIDRWVKRIYGADNPAAAAAQQDMFAILDALVAEFRTRKIRTADDFTAWFGSYFTQRDHRQGSVAIFGKNDLFAGCCALYGEMRGQTRAFPLARSLLLFAFLEYLMASPGLDPREAARRLRTIRNLVFASSNEIRPDRMAALMDATSACIRNDDLNGEQAYNSRQVGEEKAKAAFLVRFAGYPDLEETLHRLEDHPLPRGCLASFDLNVEAATFVRRARLLHGIFPADRDIPAEPICAARWPAVPTSNGHRMAATSSAPQRPSSIPSAAC
jgi:hypothetical protein